MKLRITAIMEVDLEFEDDNFELPDNIDSTDQEAVDDYLAEYASELDGGLFTEVEGGGCWTIGDKELTPNEAQS